MRRIISVGLLSLLLVANFAFPAINVRAQEDSKPAAQDTPVAVMLNNDDVIAMMKNGLSAEVIVAKIKATPCKFDTAPATLQELKFIGMPEAVIMAMIQAPVGVAGNAIAVSPDSAPLTEVKIPDGTPLEVELMSNLSSQNAKLGDVIDFIVVSPVVVNGVTVIEKGAPAKARVASVKKAGYWGKAGKIGWTMQEVLLLDGNRTPLRMEKKLTGDSKGGTVATATVVTAVVFWPAAPFWGLKKGKNAVYPAGKRFEAFVHGDVTAKGRPTTASVVQTVEEKTATGESANP
jgi:hypothetical protein